MMKAGIEQRLVYSVFVADTYLPALRNILLWVSYTRITPPMGVRGGQRMSDADTISQNIQKRKLDDLLRGAGIFSPVSFSCFYILGYIAKTIASRDKPATISMKRFNSQRLRCQTEPRVRKIRRSQSTKR